MYEMESLFMKEENLKSTYCEKEIDYSSPYVGLSEEKNPTPVEKSTLVKTGVDFFSKKEKEKVLNNGDVNLSGGNELVDLCDDKPLQMKPITTTLVKEESISKDEEENGIKKEVFNNGNFNLSGDNELVDLQNDKPLQMKLITTAVVKEESISKDEEENWITEEVLNNNDFNLSGGNELVNLQDDKPLQMKPITTTLIKEESISKDEEENRIKKEISCKAYDSDICDTGLIQRKKRKTGKRKTYMCAECNRPFSKSSNLERHMHTHLGLRPFICPDCNKAFTQASSLKVHMRVHSGLKPFICNVCNDAFSQSGHLREHMRAHTGTKPFVCAECNKAFTLSHSLKAHVRTHTGVKPYKCKECFRAFTCSGNLERHFRTHTGVKPFVCNVCNETFSQSSHLKRHMRSHTGIRPYKCTECNDAFSQSGHLEIHMRRHTGVKPYKCSECGKAFSDSSNLRRHIRTHLALKPIKCTKP